MTNDPIFTSVDLNATGTTTIYDADANAKVYGVYMDHGGSTAEVQLEATDGTNTAKIDEPGAGNDLAVGDTLALDPSTDLQVNVTTAEGAALTGTVVVMPGV